MGTLRSSAHTALSKLPAMALGAAGQTVSIGASLYPEKIKQWIGVAVTTDHVRMVGLVCAAVFAAYWLLWWLLKPKVDERGTLGFRVYAKSVGQVFAGPIGHVGDVINAAPEPTAKPQTSLEMHAHLLDYEYLDGIQRCGIRWRSGFADVQLHFLNRSDVAFENVSILIRLDFPIAVGSASSSLSDVKLGAAFRSGTPVIVGRVDDGALKVVASEAPDTDDQTLDTIYRLFCANMRASSDVLVHLAVAQRADIDQLGDIFLPVRPNPTFVDLQAEYVAYGERRTQQEVLNL